MYGMYHIVACRMDLFFIRSQHEWMKRILYLRRTKDHVMKSSGNSFFCCDAVFHIWISNASRATAIICIQTKRKFLHEKNVPSNHPIHGHKTNANCTAKNMSEIVTDSHSPDDWCSKYDGLIRPTSNLLTLLKIKKPTTFCRVSQPKIYYASMKIWNMSHADWADDIYNWDHVWHITNGHHNTWN